MEPSALTRQLVAIEEETARRAGLDLSESPSPARALREYLVRCERQEPTIEAKVSVPDPALQGVFMALCDRYGLPVYRRPRQRQTTLTVSGPATFVHDVLGAMFQQMAKAFDEWFVAQTVVVLRKFEATGDRFIKPPL